MDQDKINSLIIIYWKFFDLVEKPGIYITGGISSDNLSFHRLYMDIRDFLGDCTIEELNAAGIRLSTFICSPNYKIKYTQRDLLNMGYKIENIRYIEDFIFFCGLPRENKFLIKSFLGGINADYIDIKKLRDVGFSCKDLKKISDTFSPLLNELFPFEELIKEYSLFELDINFDKKILESYVIYHHKAKNHVNLCSQFLCIFLKRRSIKKYNLRILSAFFKRTLVNNPVSNARLFLGNILKRRSISKCSSYFQELREAAIVLQKNAKRYINSKLECDVCKTVMFNVERFKCDNYCNYCYDCLKNLIKSQLIDIASKKKKFIFSCPFCLNTLQINNLIFISKSICKMIMRVWWDLGVAMGHESFYKRYNEFKDEFGLHFLDPKFVSLLSITEDLDDKDFQDNPNYDVIARTLLKIREEHFIDYFEYLRNLSFGKGEKDELKILSQKYEKIISTDPTLAYVEDIQSRILNPRCPICKTIIYWFDGCFAIECCCGYHICGWCLDFFGSNDETHNHVVNCEFSLHAGELYGKFEEFEWVHTVRSFYKFHYYLQEISSQYFRELVQEKIIESNIMMDPLVFHQTLLFYD